MLRVTGSIILRSQGQRSRSLGHKLANHLSIHTKPRPGLPHFVLHVSSTTVSLSFLACNSGLRSAIRRHHPPQRAVLSQICGFWERKVVSFQILLDGAEPRDAGTT